MPSSCSNKKIAIVTGTRADWGLLTPLARALDASDGVQLCIVATNMHLDDRFGATASQIEDDGFAIAARVPMAVSGDDPASRVHAMAKCMDGMADALATLQPDAVVILGDRYEMLAVASAAAMMRIPIAHIAGGTVSEGAIDDALRHAITQLSTLHLTETEQHRRRVIQMGQQPDTVIATGALGVWNIMNQPLLTQTQLEQTLPGLSFDRPTVLVTYHPVTLSDRSPQWLFGQLTAALDAMPDLQVLITYPNNDAGGATLAQLAQQWADARAGRVWAVPSLGMARYLSALQFVKAVVGNSSSGIVEVPSMHIPTVDIGMRQRGRLCADSVIHCADDTESITAALRLALSDEGQRRARQTVNPYHKPDTVAVMTRAIIDMARRGPTVKKFHDIV